MKRVLLVALLACAACVVPGGKPPVVTPPVSAPQHALVVHVCDGDCALDHKIADAWVFFDPMRAGFPSQGKTDAAGNDVLGPAPGGTYSLCAEREGFKERVCVPVDLTTDNQDVNISLVRVLPTFPTRDEILAVKLTFQGLTVQTAQFGTLPWFEAALPWLTPADRQAVYAAKRAAGDTHALISLPSGPPLYNEPGQPYSADRFGPLDWTAGNTAIDWRLPGLISEAVSAGFNRQLLFLGGDDGERGFPIAMKQLDLVHDALASTTMGDLRPYVVIIPGWDGVFYGYTPEHIAQWGAKCRTLFPYCGLEHSTGHIPVGNGPADYAPGGPMAAFDLILGEFEFERFDDSLWQVLGRMIGPRYRRPAEQPADDDPSPPFYLKAGTPRGPLGYACFESGEYQWVRGTPVARIQAMQAYLRARGCPYVN